MFFRFLTSSVTVVWEDTPVMYLKNLACKKTFL